MQYGGWGGRGIESSELDLQLLEYPKPNILQEPNILHCVGHIVSVTTTKLSCCTAEAVMHYANKWVCLCTNKTLFAKTDGGSDLAYGP